jgi:thiamine pyrophosphate-dependent acetolactate synthase large subunit-like protein
MATAADVLVDTLVDWEVDTVFGLPGDGINGIMEALRKRQDVIRFVQVRHEQSAAFMATAYSRWTGKLGVCLVTSGPGGTNLLTGLYDAKLDQAPVLAITGMQYHDLIETFTQQDVDLTRVFEDVSVYNTIVSDAAHMENVASLACRTAIARRGVAHLSVANDTQEKPAGQSRSRRFDEIDSVLDEAFAAKGPVIVQALVDKYEPMMPPRMPKDYAENFEKALPETPGHEYIEKNVSREPLATMMRAEEDRVELDEKSGELPGVP